MSALINWYNVSTEFRMILFLIFSTCSALFQHTPEILVRLSIHPVREFDPTVSRIYSVRRKR